MHEILLMNRPSASASRGRKLYIIFMPLYNSFWFYFGTFRHVSTEIGYYKKFSHFHRWFGREINSHWEIIFIWVFWIGQSAEVYNVTNFGPFHPFRSNKLYHCSFFSWCKCCHCPNATGAIGATWRIRGYSLKCKQISTQPRTFSHCNHIVNLLA